MQPCVLLGNKSKSLLILRYKINKQNRKKEKQSKIP